MLKSKYPILESKKEYQNPYFSVIHEKVAIGAEHADYYVVYRNHNGIFVVPTSDNNILLISQYRQHTRSTSWEIPAGGSKNLKEDPLIAAARELKEETGYSAREFIRIGTFYILPGLSNATGYVVARNLHSGLKHLEFSEDIGKQELVPFNKVKSMIQNGEITDSMTITALHYFFLTQQ